MTREGRYLMNISVTSWRPLLNLSRFCDQRDALLDKAFYDQSLYFNPSLFYWPRKAFTLTWTFCDFRGPFFFYVNWAFCDPEEAFTLTQAFLWPSFTLTQAFYDLGSALLWLEKHLWILKAFTWSLSNLVTQRRPLLWPKLSVTKAFTWPKLSMTSEGRYFDCPFVTSDGFTLIWAFLWPDEAFTLTKAFLWPSLYFAQSLSVPPEKALTLTWPFRDLLKAFTLTWALLWPRPYFDVSICYDPPGRPLL